MKGYQKTFYFARMNGTIINNTRDCISFRLNSIKSKNSHAVLDYIISSPSVSQICENYKNLYWSKNLYSQPCTHNTTIYQGIQKLALQIPQRKQTTDRHHFTKRTGANLDDSAIQRQKNQDQLSASMRTATKQLIF